MFRENKKTYWKSPITTESLTWNTTTRVVFCELMLRVRNIDTDQLPDEEKVGYWHGNKYLPYEYVKLNRGQCMFSVDRFARDLGVNPRKIKMHIEKLIKMHIVKQIERKSFGFVVTMNNYDELIKMQIETQDEKQLEISEKSKGSNKSVYKNENIEASSNEKLELTDKDIEGLSQKLCITPEGILSYYKKIKDYEESTGKKYKNYPKTIEIWVGRLKEKGGIQL